MPSFYTEIGGGAGIEVDDGEALVVALD